MVAPIQIKRRTSGAAGAPSSLKSGELAYNMMDGYLYLGKGDDGSSNATSIVSIAKDDFNVAMRVPAGGTTGQALLKIGASDYAVAWGTVANYVAGTGIGISGSTISLASGGFSASYISSGTIDPARLPATTFAPPIVSSGELADLTSAQQSNVVGGTIIVTQSGYRWIYNGTGSKTDSSGYTQLADTTPDWNVIANKPVFATVATSGSYADLTGKPALATVATSGSYTDLSSRPTLGTMASQAASAVAITGGTMSGVTLTNCPMDGGQF